VKQDSKITVVSEDGGSKAYFIITRIEKVSDLGW